MKKRHLFLNVAVLLLTFFLPGPMSISAHDEEHKNEPHADYYDYSGLVDENTAAIIDEFSRHHMVFHPDLSKKTKLFAVPGILEDVDVDPYGTTHDHSGDDTSYQKEHCASIVIRATADENGKYHTVALDHIPGMVFTYKDIYIVSVTPERVTVDVTRALKGEVERVPWKPDPTFLKDLAARLHGKLDGNSIVLP